jgi:hypothetical protein
MNQDLQDLDLEINISISNKPFPALLPALEVKCQFQMEQQGSKYDKSITSFLFAGDNLSNRNKIDLLSTRILEESGLSFSIKDEREIVRLGKMLNLQLKKEIDAFLLKEENMKTIGIKIVNKIESSTLDPASRLKADTISTYEYRKYLSQFVQLKKRIEEQNPVDREKWVDWIIECLKAGANEKDSIELFEFIRTF